MATIQIAVDTDRITFRENIDRDGPMLSILLTDKQAMRQAINTLTNHGDEIIADGIFSRTSDKTRQPVGIFLTQADADAFQLTKGAGFVVETEEQVDGFNWKVLQVT